MKRVRNWLLTDGNITTVLIIGVIIYMAFSSALGFITAFIGLMLVAALYTK